MSASAFNGVNKSHHDSIVFELIHIDKIRPNFIDGARALERERKRHFQPCYPLNA